MGSPRLVPNSFSDCSTEGDDPLVLYMELNEEDNASEKASQDDLDRLLTAHQKLVVSHEWVVG